MTYPSVTANLWGNIIASMHNGVIVVNSDNQITLMNESAQRLLSVQDDEWKGKSIKSLIPHSRMHEVLEGGEGSIGEKMVISGRACMVNRTPLYENGERVGAIAVIQDISEMDHYQNLLKQMESIIEFSTDGIYVVDQEGVTMQVNTAYEEITGFRREELIGRRMVDLMSEGYFDQSVSLLVLERKQRISIIQRIGGKKDVIVTGNPVFDEQGGLEMVVTSVRDITHLNDLKKELEKAHTFSQIQNNRYTIKSEETEQTLIFRSPQIIKVYEHIKQVAPYPTSILLYGPSGTGKEVMANLIHDLSERREQPFIKINCGAIPEQLLESELFGYEAGAFSGASRNGKIGLLELADKGTVMLDEIAELPLALQVKLLRVLQERQMRRIGGTKSRQLDIRIVAATNQDLRHMIKSGKFREDLFYRLAVVEIAIPSLAERQEDIAPLMDHYFAYFCRQYRIDKQMTHEAKEMLKKYHWPGNVRELRNLIENMIVSVPAKMIEPVHLPLHIQDQSQSDSFFTLKVRVQQFERRIINEVVEKNSSLRKAAEQLGIDHSTLVKKLQRWEKDNKSDR
ncbi:sigma-54 interaction domain-containing protein [Paenibacillus radicis (ex Xue et al. 2023)]|uniref:HTH-type transcriptional regulatory protein TyrR n=1 Tax=Paenibacillus radicis (ex Xue et al. 2023) TaxID=2972489 RepID=A0ABT1YN22_9BACL|nr:sigma 54-interacting transcriptional regulator [Paenibacillus radicis (ex Xue et al. 2023)]MCR8633688.1 sigma 54-interacting transcriptional regulator [Paenibacillus radicis (ex Xue et al. 2023)]